LEDAGPCGRRFALERRFVPRFGDAAYRQVRNENEAKTARLRTVPHMRLDLFSHPYETPPSVPYVAHFAGFSFHRRLSSISHKRFIAFAAGFS
jgi:hypothetical protein